MKFTHKILIATAASLLSFVAANAQALQTGYFLDGYYYGYKLNPAFQNEKGFLGLALGPIAPSVQSNLGIKSLLYPLGNGKLGTFLHPDLTTAYVMKNFDADNSFHLNLDYTLLSVGFRTKDLYHTVEINIHSASTGSLPYDLFRFLKEGTGTNGLYDLSGVRLNSRNYLELAYGLSRRVDRYLSVGGRIKFLAGVANVDARIPQMDVYMGADTWTVNARGTVRATAPVTYATKTGSDVIDLDSFQFSTSKLGLAGIGAAIDFGASYDASELVPGLSFSAALLDLGAIRWKNGIAASTANVPVVILSPDEDIRDLADTDHLKDKLKAIYEFHDEPGGNASLEMITMTYNFGAQYKMPFCDKLSVGLLCTLKTDIRNNFLEGRGSINLAPLKWLSFAVSGGYNTYGPAVGAALNIHPGWLNLFIGTDTIFTEVSKQYIPIGPLNTNLVFGLNIPIGRKYRYAGE